MLTSFQVNSKRTFWDSGNVMISTSRHTFFLFQRFFGVLFLLSLVGLFRFLFPRQRLLYGRILQASPSPRQKRTWERRFFAHCFSFVLSFFSDFCTRSSRKVEISRKFNTEEKGNLLTLYVFWVVYHLSVPSVIEFTRSRNFFERSRFC